MLTRTLTLIASLFLASAALGEPPKSPVVIHHEKRSAPNEQIYWAEVDLANPAVSIRVCPGGPDPDGDGQYQTTLMQPSKIAAREGFDLVVNGDFFAVPNVKDAEGKAAGYRAEQWASVIGTAVTDGKTWSVASKNRPALILSADGKPQIEAIAQPPKDAAQVISGNVMLVKDGKAVPSTNPAAHPRTIVGLDKGRTKLIIVVVDGRSKESAGMTYVQEGELMKQLGADVAMNLDGGGSSAFVVRDAESGKLHALNRPSDGRERAVANVLGITVKDPARKPTTQPVEHK